MTLHVATCAYPIERLPSFDAFREKQHRLVREAADHGARLLVFPEYACMELGALGTSGDAPRELSDELSAMAALHAEYLRIYADLSREFGVVICAPSFPESLGRSESEGRRHVNRAHVFAPGGQRGFSDKCMMTRFERELWGIDAGSAQNVFESDFGCFGVAICYDSEFPNLVRRQVDAGAQVVLVPSCTDTLAGYYRVQLSCRARALENQCFFVQSVTVGSAPWSSTVDENTGAAGIFGPVDRGFPSDGVLAQGELNAPGWVYAELDLERLKRVREDGQVRNHRDWSDPKHHAGSVGRVWLSG